MAAKKKAVTKRKATGKQLTTESAIQAELAKYADQATEHIKKGTGQKISLTGKEFSLGEQSLGRELQVIILGHTYERRFYLAPYDKENPSTPACYALGVDQNQLTPASDSPHAQCSTCIECDHDQWGSSNTGKGKACGTHIRLLIVDGMIEDSSPIEKRLLETPIISVGPTSIKAYEGFVTQLNKRLRIPPFAVRTLLTFDQEVDYPKLEFEIVEQIKDLDLLRALIELKEETFDLLHTGYDPEGYTEAVRGGKKKPVKKKATVKKKVPTKKRSKF